MQWGEVKWGDLRSKTQVLDTSGELVVFAPWGRRKTQDLRPKPRPTKALEVQIEQLRNVKHEQKGEK